MARGLRIIVCGGRKYDDRPQMKEVLTKLHEERPIVECIHGDARGADILSGYFFKKFYPEVAMTPVPADWDKYGRAAGAIRNKVMLAMKPDVVVAFPGGRGTANMISIARKAGIEVIEVPQLND